MRIFFAPGLPSPERALSVLAKFVSILTSSALKGGGHGPGKQGAEGPELFRHKGKALFFTLHDEAERHRLHTPGGNAALHGLPEQGRDLVAHKAVEHAAGLLGVEEVGVDVVRILKGGLHGARRDFVELDALDILGLILDDLGNVPGNGLTFAVRVRGEENGVRLGGGILKILHDLFLALDDLILGGEVAGLIHADGARRQVADMADAGLHHILAAQKFLDGLHLGR